MSINILNRKTSETASTSSVGSAALFISGASLGAGLLALPIETGLAGLVPALTGLVFIWALMLATGFILTELFVEMDQPSSGLFSLYAYGLGRWVGWLVTPSYFLIFYGVLVAYLSGSGSVLANLLHQPRLEGLFLLIFFLFSSCVVLVGMRFINRANAVFMFLLISSFAGLLVIAGRHVDAGNFGFQDWTFPPSAFPIIICAFAYKLFIGQGGFAVLLGAFIGVIGVVMVETFDKNIRMSGVSVSFNLCFAMFGGTAPMVSSWLIHTTHDSLSVAWYLDLVSAVSCIAALTLPETYTRELD